MLVDAAVSTKPRAGAYIELGGRVIRIGAFAVDGPFVGARDSLADEASDPGDGLGNGGRSACGLCGNHGGGCRLDQREETEGLAVAMLVTVDKNNTIPSAIAHDLDAKPRLVRNRPFLLHAFLSSYILIVIAVGAVTAIVLAKKDRGNDSPTYYREQRIKERVKAIVGAQELQNLYSPYYKALQWITYQDPMQATTNSSALLQRYFMAYFYYATTVERPWNSCNPPVAETKETCFMHLAKAICHLPSNQTGTSAGNNSLAQ